MGKRSFSELSVVATGVQNIEDRFGKRRRSEYDVGVPSISQWRCNLTALSQTNNLYFAAYGASIYVYAPTFPTQALPSEPSLIVTSQPTSQHLTGYLDLHTPHSINNLLVQYLGTEEVVATVRDDGDVEAVLVRHIVQAIARRTEPGCSFGLTADELKPVFHENVGVSAWGLAIHSEGRVLATSSNACEVRIFKFGLTSQSGENGDDRSMDVTQRVLNGNANIPSIAFCNTGDDPTARWLLTTDISGYSRVMDLHRPEGEDATAQQFRFGRSFLGQGGGFDRLNAGWAVFFLDRRSFLAEKKFQTAVGLAENEHLPGRIEQTVTWDLSDTVDLIPGSSLPFTRKKRESIGDPDTRALRTDVTEPHSDIDQMNEDANVLTRRLDDDETDRAMGQHANEVLMGQQLEIERNNDNEVHFMVEDSGSDGEESIASDFDDDISLSLEDADPEDEGTEATTPISALYGGKRIFGNTPYFLHSASLCEDLPCPILHASVKNIYLLQPSNQRHHVGAFCPPMVGMANALRQAVGHEFGYLNMFDRLNMSAYIPSLGVVVIASQKGRALVLSLTKLSASVRYPADMQPGRKTNYAMRVECILPFGHQEREGKRPFAPLHGIATSPVQGDVKGRKRWRLMMMYQDHTVLSYEITRPIVSGGGVDMAGLIV